MPPTQNSAPVTAFPNGVLTSPAVAYRFVVPLRVHHGATMWRADLTLYIGPGHFAVPSSLPQMRIYAVDALGDIIPMSGIVGSDGWRSIATPASPAAYNSSTQTLTYAIGPGGLGLPIDRANFIYMAEIVDEFGVGALPGNAYDNVSCLFNGITDLRAQ